ncbi:4A/4B type thioredoxin-like protein [Stemphylium lycopersici]|nr:4A/4B type thioredoxin-like protein [Stemphylium lycopersici]
MSTEKSHRLYVKGRHVSYQRSKHNTNPKVSLLQLEGVDSTKAAEWYLGKRVAYVYRVGSSKSNPIRVIWGKIRRTHGSYTSLGLSQTLTRDESYSPTRHNHHHRNTPPRTLFFPRTHFLRTMGSVVLPHLRTGWHVDQAILSEEDRLVLIRFGRDSDPDCMSQDEVLYKIADRVKNFCAIYLCDLDEVPDFKAMYELYDPCTVMFFFRNKHMMCDFGTGNNNKLNWVLEDKQEFVDIIETSPSYPSPHNFQHRSPRQQVRKHNYHLSFPFYYDHEVESHFEAFECLVYEDILDVGGRYEARGGRLKRYPNEYSYIRKEAAMDSERPTTERNRSRSPRRSPGPPRKPKNFSGLKYKGDRERRDPDRRRDEGRDRDRGDRSDRRPRDHDRSNRRRADSRSPRPRSTNRSDRRRSRSPRSHRHRDSDRERERRPRDPDRAKEPKKAAAPAAATPSEPMILVTINDRLGTKTQVPCLPSDPIKLLKAMVAAKIGRPVHEIMLKRQGERPFHDNLTCADYAISNGVQIDLELNTGD